MLARAAFVVAGLTACSGSEVLVALTRSTPKAALVLYDGKEERGIYAFEPVPPNIELLYENFRVDLLLYDQTLEELGIQVENEQVKLADTVTPVDEKLPFPTPDAWWIRDNEAFDEAAVSDFSTVFGRLKILRPPCPTVHVELVSLETYAPAAYLAPLDDDTVVVGLGPFSAPTTPLPSHEAELYRVTPTEHAQIEVPGDGMRGTLEYRGATAGPGKVLAFVQSLIAPIKAVTIDRLGNASPAPLAADWGRVQHAAGAVIKGRPQVYAVEAGGNLAELDLNTGERRAYLGGYPLGCGGEAQLEVFSDGSGYLIGGGQRPVAFQIDTSTLTTSPLAPFSADDCRTIYRRNARGLEVAFDTSPEMTTRVRWRTAANADWEPWMAPRVIQGATLVGDDLIVATSDADIALLELSPTPRLCPGVGHGANYSVMITVGNRAVASGFVNTRGNPNRVAWISVER